MKPIDWLAARGLTSKDDTTAQERVELEQERFVTLAKRKRKERGLSLSAAYDSLARELGFKHFAEYRKHMLSVGQWLNHDERVRKKQTRLRAKREAERVRW